MSRWRLAWPVAVGLLGAGLIALAAVRASRTTRGPASVPAATPGAVAVINGVAVVEMGLVQQRLSGVASAPIRAAAAPSAAKAYGVVMDLQPLADWRGHYVAAVALSGAARVRADTATAELERQRGLYRDGRNVSLRSLQAAGAGARAAGAAQAVAGARLQALRVQALQQFGPVLARWAGEGGATLQRLLQRREVLLRVALPPGALPPPRTLDVEMAVGSRRRARRVGAVARVDPPSQGDEQLFVLDAPLPANASVVVDLPAADGVATGSLVPLRAVVWTAGQPWVYVQRDASHFTRLPLLDATESAAGYFVPRGLTPGEPVVTQGAGLLLSQEQIAPPGASGCRDPECDDD
jgi:hypothetical protein